MAIKQTKQETALRSIVQQEIANSENADSTEIHGNRRDALDYYEGRKPPPDPAWDGAIPETSENSIVSTDVADMTNAVLAQLTPMLSTDALVTFESNGKEDEEAARAESHAVNNVIIERNQGFIELEESIKDALLMRNGAVKVFIEDDVSVRTVSTRLPSEGDAQLPPEQIAALLQPRRPEETRELVGDKVRITTTIRTFRTVAVPIDNILYEANASHSDVQRMRFFAERLYYTRSDLVDMGYPKATVDSLTATTDETNMVSRTRNKSGQTPNNAHSRDQDVIECFECYLLYDLDGDGISERLKILYAGGYVLDHEEAEYVPYAVGTAFIQAHRLLGESLFDHLKQTQVQKTFLIRNWLDNLEHVSQGRWLADPRNHDFADITGGSSVIKSKDTTRPPVRFDERDAGPSFLAALTYQDKMRTERGGAALDMMSADAQLVGETAYGIERQYGQRELLVSFMARNLAETLIRPMYLLMHEFMRLYANAPISLKYQGEWVEVDPRQWPQRVRCNVKAGMSAGERTHIQRTLGQLLQIQTTAMQQGLNGQLADLSTVYNTISDWAVMAGLDEPDNYVINPKSQGAQQAAQQAAQQQQAQAQAQQQLANEALNLERMKLAQQAKEAGDELAYKYWSDRLKAETDEAKIVAQGIVDLEKVQLQGEQREIQALNGAASGAGSNSGNGETA